jgi:MinD superfamily P-loop ATPase
LALAVTKKLRLPQVVLLNKKGLPGPDVYSFCKNKGIPIVAEIPHERSIAEAYSEGRLLVSIPEHERVFRSALARILEEVRRA